MHLAANIDLLSGAIGGLLIGVSSTSFLILTGKLTGLSGFVEEAMLPVKKDDQSWISHKSFSLTYIAGLIASGYAVTKYNPNFHNMENDSTITTALIIAGLLVGYGTRLGSGCTSGHGVCGLSRFSPRSAVAVATFMTTGAIGAFLGRIMNVKGYFIHLNGIIFQNLPIFGKYSATIITYTSTFAILHLLYKMKVNNQMKINKKNDDIHSHKIDKTKKLTDLHITEHIAAFACSFLFGIGLNVSGMCDSGRVIGFLDFTGPKGWDPSLAAVMGGAVTFNIIAFQLLRYYKKSVVIKSICGTHRGTLDKILKIGLHSDNTKLTKDLVLGSALFGIGWGIAGLCPGPAIVMIGASSSTVAVFIPSLLIGIFAQDLLHH
jgi:hypothetical protein